MQSQSLNIKLKNIKVKTMFESYTLGLYTYTAIDISMCLYREIVSAVVCEFMLSYGSQKM